MKKCKVAHLVLAIKTKFMSDGDWMPVYKELWIRLLEKIRSSRRLVWGKSQLVGLMTQMETEMSRKNLDVVTEGFKTMNELRAEKGLPPILDPRKFRIMKKAKK